jgi:uncharacterized membrane protein YqhA
MTRSQEPETTERDPGPVRWLESGFEWGLLLSRLLILIPVIVLVISAAAAFIYDAALFIRYTADTIGRPFPIGNRIGNLLLVIDLFLVGATMLIAAIGFYELFISRVDVGGRRRGVLPGWLVMHDLNDLKARVISMLALVTAVSFVDVVVDFHFHSGHDILFLGVAVALVITALTVFLRFGASGREGS